MATVTTTVDPRAVHVQVRLDGDLGPLVGHARAAASPDGTIRAAAQATIDALAPRLPGASIRVETLAHLPEAAAPHVTAIVTVIRHDRVHQLVGSALAHHSPAHAAAEATLRAVQEALDDPDDLAPDLDAAAPTPEDLDASSLLAVASHQLRGPVGVLAGYLELLTARWPSLDDLARQQMADRAATQGQRIMHRLDNLLTITTHRSTRPRATPAVAAVRDLVVQAVDDLPAVDLADVTIEVPEGLLVLADVDHVRQIVANLIDNARRHGAPPVTVTAAHVGRDRVRTCVADGGAGVPASHRAHLFDPQRPDRSVTAGSGLGLHITRLLASANQGSVDYLPDPAGGSRFCLVLPAPAHTGAGAAAWDAGRRALGQAPARS